MRLVVAFLAVVVLAAPALAQSERAAPSAEDPLCIITFSTSADFAEVDIVQDLVLTDADRARILAEADADQDGTVTTAEVAVYETASRNSSRIEESPGNGGERRLVRDGSDLPTLLVWSDLAGAEGPANGSRTFKAAEVREYTFGFGGREAVAHIFNGGMDASYEPRAVIETLVVQAPDGWAVWTINGTEHRTPSVTIRGFDVRGQYSIAFLKDGVEPEKAFFGEPQGGPALGVLAALVGVAAVAFWRRRA